MKKRTQNIQNTKQQEVQTARQHVHSSSLNIHADCSLRSRHRRVLLYYVQLCTRAHMYTYVLQDPQLHDSSLNTHADCSLSSRHRRVVLYCPAVHTCTHVHFHIHVSRPLVDEFSFPIAICIPKSV